MGYADTVPTQQITITTTAKEHGTVDSIAGSNFNIANFYVPSYKFPLAYAYMDVIAQSIQDTSGADNYLVNNGSFGFDDAGATYRVAQAIANESLFIEANGKAHVHYILTGTNNLAPYIKPGDVLLAKLSQLLSFGNTLVFRNCYAQLRLYFN